MQEMVTDIETQNWTVCGGRDFGMLSLRGMFALYPSPKGLGIYAEEGKESL